MLSSTLHILKPGLERVRLLIRGHAFRKQILSVRREKVGRHQLCEQSPLQMEERCSVRRGLCLVTLEMGAPMCQRAALEG